MSIHYPVRVSVCVAAALGLLSCSTARGAASTASSGATHTVVIDGNRFEPESLTVNIGDAVVWVNKDPFPHTATARPTFDSGRINEGKSWTYRPATKGEFPYICTLHPSMKATLTVQ